MIIIRNNIIPFRGFKAINLFGILFCREGAKIDEYTINHEKIHTAQMIEMLFIFFYVWYGIEYLLRLIKRRSAKSAYRNMGFEREAYTNEYNLDYLKSRKFQSWVKYL